MLSEVAGSNYLLMNAVDIFWTDDNIVEDMIKQIRDDEERLLNWQELPEDELPEILVLEGPRFANYYSMNEPSNPYNIGEVELRLWRCLQRVWKTLHECS